MISVLICSNNNFFLDQVRDNIKKTIGVEYEILHFDNSTAKKGICSVYNSLAKKAKFPFLCFVHEDILFETVGWGLLLCDIFMQRTDVGVVGVAGSKYKSKTCSGWFSGIQDFDCAHIRHDSGNERELMFLRPDSSRNLEEVVCLDGVLICTRREILERSGFDEKELTGFHFYDIDFSLRASAFCAVFVTFEIDIIHITAGGDFGNNWVETAMRFHARFQDRLPDTKLVPHSKKSEVAIARTWLDLLKKNNISWRNKMRWIGGQRLQFQPALYYSIAKFLLYRPLGLRYIHKLFKRVT